MRRSDVYFANLDPRIGSEADKVRPCVIVSNDANNRRAPTVTVVPITSNVKRVYPFEVLIERELERPCKAQANQVRTISKLRLADAPIGSLMDDTMQLVDAALKVHLRL